MLSLHKKIKNYGKNVAWTRRGLSKRWIETSLQNQNGLEVVKGDKCLKEKKGTNWSNPV